MEEHWWAIYPKTSSSWRKIRIPDYHIIGEGHTSSLFPHIMGDQGPSSNYFKNFVHTPICTEIREQNFFFATLNKQISISAGQQI
jgi:hypothetical protein